MLIEFRVTNFRSIRETQVFSLVANNSDKELRGCINTKKLPGLSGVQFLKGAAIYGANASGKSNLLGALSFLASLVTGSATKVQPGDLTGVEPFKLDPTSSSKPTKFEITFVAEGVRYLFGLLVTPKKILEEYLIAYPKGSPQKWYHRKFKTATRAYEWDRPSIAFKDDKGLRAKVRENSLFLSVGPQFNHRQLTKVYNWFNKSLRFIHLSVENFLLPSFTAKKISNPKYRSKILNLLKSADFGVREVATKEREINTDEMKMNLPPALLDKLERQGGLKPFKHLEIQLAHAAEGIEPVALNFQNEESAGTQRFFALLGPWIDVLENGYTVLIDEIETSLHPLLVKELLKLIFSNKNSNGAQVVFTTHNPILLDNALMRRDQVWFTEKNKAGATYIYPLTDYRPRKNEAFGKGYLGGRYGAIPFIPEGLKA